MPKFIGRQISNAIQIQDNAGENSCRVKLSYSQIKLLPHWLVICSLDTTDKGSKGSYAKRWFRWFASPSAILASSKSTENMLEKARKMLTTSK